MSHQDLIKMDYAEIEARIAAWLAADPPQPDRRISENDRRALARWFPDRRAS